MTLSLELINRKLAFLGILFCSLFFSLELGSPREAMAQQTTLRASFTLGNRDVQISFTPPDVSRMVGPYITVEGNALKAQFENARNSVFKQNHQNTIDGFMAHYKGQVNLDSADIAAAKWLSDEQARGFATGDGIPLNAEAPYLVDAILKRDIYAVGNALAKVGRNIELERTLPAGPEGTKDTLERAVKGVAVNRDGVIAGLPDAPPPVPLYSSWGTKAGQRVRNSLNFLMINKQAIDADHREYCKTHTEAECAAKGEDVRQFHYFYFQTALLLAMADRMGILRSPEFQSLMLGLERAVQFQTGVAQGILKTGQNLMGGMGTLIRHPLDTTEAVTRGLMNAISQGTLFDSIKETVKRDWNTILDGSAEDKGRIIGHLTGEVILVLVPGAKISTLVEGWGLTALSVTSGIAPDAITAASRLAASGALPIFKDALEKTTTNLAMQEKFAALEARGSITPALAKESRALAQAFPRTAEEILKDPDLAPALQGFDDLLGRTKPSELFQTSSADANVSTLIRNEKAPALDFIKQHGFDAGAGLAKIENARPGTLAEWGKVGANEADLANLSREIAHTLNLAPKAPEFHSLKNLLQSAQQLSKEGFSVSPNAREFLVRQANGTSALIDGKEFHAISEETFTRIGKKTTPN